MLRVIRCCLQPYVERIEAEMNSKNCEYFILIEGGFGESSRSLAMYVIGIQRLQANKYSNCFMQNGRANSTDL